MQTMQHFDPHYGGLVDASTTVDLRIRTRQRNTTARTLSFCANLLCDVSNGSPGRAGSFMVKSAWFSHYLELTHLSIKIPISRSRLLKTVTTSEVKVLWVMLGSISPIQTNTAQMQASTKLLQQNHSIKTCVPIVPHPTTPKFAVQLTRSSPYHAVMGDPHITT